MIAIYPGTFDPITNGHLDIIERCSKKFDKVVVAVLNNTSKKTLFTVEERLGMISSIIGERENIEIDAFSGLLIDYAKSKGVSVIVRGLRAVSDFEYEMQMALTNKSLNEEIDTFFLISSNQYSFLSSSIVKEIARFDGDISNLVPAEVEKKVKMKFLKEDFNGHY